MRAPFLPVTFTLFLLAAAPFGCRPESGPSLEKAEKDYHAGLYRQAYNDARELRVVLSGPQQDRASYLAGICAFRMGNHSQAISLLSPLLNNTDRLIAGRSASTLGLIYRARGEDNKALEAFRTATGKLSGDEAAWCHFYIAVIQQKMGWWSNASGNLSTAARLAMDHELQRMIRQRKGYRAFAVQAGAYRSKDIADKRARLLAAQAQAAGMGSPRVIPSTSAAGGKLYLVQVGRFIDYQRAHIARHKLRAEELIIVPVK